MKLNKSVSIVLFSFLAPLYLIKHSQIHEDNLFSINISILPFVFFIVVLTLTFCTLLLLMTSTVLSGSTEVRFLNFKISLVSATNNFEFFGFLYLL